MHLTLSLIAQDNDAPVVREYRLRPMRNESVVARSLHSPLIAAGWVFAVVVPPVGLVIGVRALRKPFPQPLRAQAAAIVAVSLLGSLMWALILTGAPASHGFFTS